MKYFMGTLLGTNGFPQEFYGKDSGTNINRIFIELQRLEVFGLIESRRNPVFHSEDTQGRLRRTRYNIYSRRKDFRISAWGSHYVENEVSDSLKQVVRDMVKSRHEIVIDVYEEIGKLYWRLCERPNIDTKECNRLECLERFYYEVEQKADGILKAKACPLVLCLPACDHRPNPSGT